MIAEMINEQSMKSSVMVESSDESLAKKEVTHSQIQNIIEEVNKSSLPQIKAEMKNNLRNTFKNHM